MKKFNKASRALALGLASIMLVGAMAGCSKKSASKVDLSALDAPQGKVLNVYVWNDEFINRVADHYPGYVKVSETEGKIGDVAVKFHLTPNENNAYQDNLDNHLDKQSSAAADDKIDIFLVEADYALKYVNTEDAMPIQNLGITADDLKNQYQYTKDVVTDSNGVLKGVSWQGCPGVVCYSRAIAKDVLGTDDPAEVQKAVANWDEFEKTAAKMKEKGYYMVSGYDDTYRVFSNNVTSAWVDKNKNVVIDKSIMQWVEQTKRFTEKGYNNGSSLWNDVWNQGFYPAGNVFCYFGPAWLINFCMKADDPASIAGQGGWAATEGPQGFFWGGTWICAANGTDNAVLVKDIILKLTCDENVMLGIVKKDSDFVNNKPAMEKAATNPEYAFPVLGGQNPLAMFANGANAIDLKYLSIYDQGCNEEFQGAMKDYFQGNATLDEALANFKAKIVIKYPALTAK